MFKKIFEKNKSKDSAERADTGVDNGTKIARATEAIKNYLLQEGDSLDPKKAKKLQKFLEELDRLNQLPEDQVNSEEVDKLLKNIENEGIVINKTSEIEKEGSEKEKKTLSKKAKLIIGGVITALLLGLGVYLATSGEDGNDNGGGNKPKDPTEKTTPSEKNQKDAQDILNLFDNLSK